MTSADDAALNKQLAILLSKCARSDEVAFTDVYNLTSAKLFAVIVRSLGMNASAEHALQDTFVKIWLQAGDFQSELREPMTWLTGIARSHVAQILRNQRQQDDIGVSLPASKIDHSELAEVQFLDKRDVARNLEAGLNRLEDQPRDCIVRAYAEGSSLTELSELHDAPPKTVKSWIERGLLSLKAGAHGLS